MKKILAFIIINIFYLGAPFAGGLGSQSWGERLRDDGVSNLSGWNVIWIGGVFAACYWIAFSDKSPLANKGFLWQMAVFLFGPAILVAIILTLIRWF